MCVDHLLSYFLGGEGTADNTTEADDIIERSPDKISESNDLKHGSFSAPTLDQSNAESKSPEGSILKRSSSMGRSSLSVHFLDGIPEEPTSFNDLSVMQDRINSNGSMPTVPSTASSSSSSLSNMAAALAIGGKDQMMYIHQKLQGREIPSASAVQLNNTSPITPVNMMGSPAGHENMMLPPPPRFPTGTMHAQPNYFQPMMQTQWSQQQPMNQAHSPNTQQHLSWIQQMNAACLAAQQQQAAQPHTQDVHMTSPSPIPSTTASQPQQIQSMQFQQPQIQHQIQVGVDGATVPVMAIANPDGTVSYHIDPNTSAVPQAGLRYLTKAINEVVKPEDPEKEDPAVLAEKRLRRLARNRESARQSRRRKKDHLNNLAEKVKKLQRLLDIEITSQIASMETGMAELKASLLEKSGEANTDIQSPSVLIQSTSPNCAIRRAVILHQYNLLRQAFLSTQNHFSVWLMMKNEQYFADGCRASQKLVESKGSRTTISRPNSKQGGEDIINKEKTGDRLVSSHAEDAPRMWPLLCHELTLTMDQEERVVNQAHVE